MPRDEEAEQGGCGVEGGKPSRRDQHPGPQKERRMPGEQGRGVAQPVAQPAEDGIADRLGDEQDGGEAGSRLSPGPHLPGRENGVEAHHQGPPLHQQSRAQELPERSAVQCER